jgi:hypothetical protein
MFQPTHQFRFQLACAVTVKFGAGIAVSLLSRTLDQCTHNTGLSRLHGNA